MDVYRPSSPPRIVNVFNMWIRTRIGQEPEQCVQVCTILEIELSTTLTIRGRFEGL